MCGLCTHLELKSYKGMPNYAVKPMQLMLDNPKECELNSLM